MILRGETMTNYIFDLDEHFDDLWHQLEEIQDGGSGHQIMFKAETVQDAADKMASRLVFFFEKRLKKEK